MATHLFTELGESLLAQGGIEERRAYPARHAPLQVLQKEWRPILEPTDNQVFVDDWNGLDVRWRFQNQAQAAFESNRG